IDLSLRRWHGGCSDRRATEFGSESQTSVVREPYFFPSKPPAGARGWAVCESSRTPCLHLFLLLFPQHILFGTPVARRRWGDPHLWRGVGESWRSADRRLPPDRRAAFGGSLAC